MEDTDYKLHFGVYGVAFKDDKLLCISKNSGPYKNRYDLPGGSQERGEGLTDTLVREVFEETGFTVLDYKHPRIYDSFLKIKNYQVITHHVFSLYSITVNGKADSIPDEVVDGKNDSDGVLWLALDDLNPSNASPLILKVIDEESKKTDLLDKNVFEDWEILNN
ncbi:NUDIX hydrolase [Alkalibacterium sp. 20]|uniref:NUDIX hydrolase n=1 Tax=Alkalibacterium sp. 20 TaxID=1798803 RepID=UPI00091AF4E0|nr:NUDIX hydrolase [Alkalibacterium sp. 20]OJF95511.1 NUDIX hydrolase [Alkalibacterium sp. 20]